MNTQTSTLANTFYEDNGWKVGFPWLYYARNANEVLSQKKRVKMRVSFGYEDETIGILSSLTYQLAIFTLDGEFKGFETVTDQLLACQISNAEIAQLRRFGSTISQSCTFDLSNLISSSIYDHPPQENLFYELYL